jgi:hypothetical protein
MAKRGSRVNIKVPAGQPELAAELEVTKTIAFYALMASLRALEGDTRARIESFERGINAFFSSCEIDLSPDECARITASSSRNFALKLIPEVHLEPGRQTLRMAIPKTIATTRAST